MATIRDVAQLAGVSPITVSRALNNDGPVNVETRQRIEAAVAELHYIPNSLARSLKSKATHLIALILVDIVNSFWATLARGVEDTASELGFNVMLCNVDESMRKQSEYVDVALRKQVDGVILLPFPGSEGNITRIQRQNVPLVVLDAPVGGFDLDVVRADSRQGAHDLATYLIELGHRDIAMLAGPNTHFTARERRAAYEEVMAAAGLAPRVVENTTGYNMDGGRQTARDLLATGPLPTAVFTANNFMAIGALQALREAGLEAPRDYSIGCIDDIALASMIDPFLTCAAQPAFEMGQAAATLLIDRLTGRGPAEPQEIVLPVPLLKRRSCQPPTR